jgi:putative FmdB family regulatory protein
MPVYEFRCKDCRHVFNLSYNSYTDYENALPACPRCQSADLSRLIRKVSFLTPEETRMERLADPSRLAGLDENDPRSMGRMMRQMASESGEDLGSEFGEVVDRLEAGESPESIEKSLPSGGLDTPMGGDL